MARRAAWISVAVSALVGLFLLDRWAEPATLPRAAPLPVLTAPVTPPDETGPMAALAPISLPPPPAPRVESVPETNVSEPPPEPELIVHPMKAKPAPTPERADEAEQPDTAAIKPLRPSPEPSPPPIPKATPEEAAPGVAGAPPAFVIGGTPSGGPPGIAGAPPAFVIGGTPPGGPPVDGSEKQVASSGRVLLRLLEHGSGPTVEIAWPAQSQAREQLYDRFLRCYGMTVAVMDDGNRLFVADGSPGQPWAINLDLYSGFVRQAKGRATRTESALVRTIKDRHPGLRRGQPVHIFPRATDAVLLGGLRQLVGEAYVGARVVHAVYRLGGRRLFVENVRVEGEAIAGRIDLSGAARANCA